MRSLTMARRSAAVRGSGALEHFIARDERGLIPVYDDPDKGRVHLTRRVQGDWLKISYFVQSDAQQRHHDLEVSEAGVRALGYSLLALPDGSGELDVKLSWALRALDVPQAVTSFGRGREQRVRTTMSELGHSFYVAGNLRIVDEGPARVVVWGDTAFAPEQAAAKTAAVLRAARRRFESGMADRPADSPYTLFFFSDPRMGNSRDGLAFHGSAGVWLDPGHRFDEPIMILVAHEVVHQWIGGKLRLVDGEGQEAVWFSEGLSVHYARDLLLSADLLSADAFARDVTRDLIGQHHYFKTLTMGVTSRNAWRRIAPRYHASPAYHQGALYAARLDGQLRRAGRGGLDAIILPLLAQADHEHGTQIADFRRALQQELGSGVAAELEAAVVRADEPIELLAESYGEHFRLMPTPSGSGRLVVSK